MNVANMKKLIVVAADIGTALGGVLADGQVSLSDLRYAVQIISAVKGLVELDYKSLQPEIKDMDDTEKAELDAAFRARFDIKADTIEAGIEEGIALVLAAIKGISSIADLGGRVKAAA